MSRRRGLFSAKCVTLLSAPSGRKEEKIEEGERTFETLSPGQIVLSSMSDYAQVPAGEPLKAHISRIETIRTPGFDSEALETKLVVSFHLDEDINGKGQVYTAWLRPSINPKSKMFKMLHAIYGGNIPAQIDPAVDLPGMPVRIILTEGIEKNGKTRQYVDNYLKPSSDQARVELDKVVDIPDSPDILDLEDVFKD